MEALIDGVPTRGERFLGFVLPNSREGSGRRLRSQEKTNLPCLLLCPGAAVLNRWPDKPELFCCLLLEMANMRVVEF